MTNIYHNTKITQLLDPVTATATQNSTYVDAQGFDLNPTLIALIGQSGDTLSGSVYWTIQLEHSDTTSGFTSVSNTDTLGGAASYVVDAAAEDEQAYIFGYAGGKRYVRVSITKTGTHSNGTPLAVLALSGSPAVAPVV